VGLLLPGTKVRRLLLYAGPLMKATKCQKISKLMRTSSLYTVIPSS